VKVRKSWAHLLKHGITKNTHNSFPQ